MSVSKSKKEMNFTDEAGLSFILNVHSIFKNKQQDRLSLMYVAPTGKGKSYFIQNGFVEYCRDYNHKILYLVPRKALKEEFEKEIKRSHKDDVVTVRSYQHYEIASDLICDDMHDIIICDECHYFVSDSIFNSSTEKSYNWIMNRNSKKVKIFITATPHPIQERIIEDMKKKKGALMTTDLEGVSPIDKIEFFSVAWEDLKKRNVEKILKVSDSYEIQEDENLLNEIPANEKAIVFCDTTQYAHDLYKKYEGQSIFICSRDNPKNKKFFNDIVDEDTFSKILTEHKFDCKYLFCTSALDVGISFRDTQIKRIICMLHDWNSIVQAIGRKRMIDKNDTVTLHLPYYNGKGIGGLMRQVNSKFEHYYYLKEYGAEAYLQKYQKQYDPAKIVYYRDIGGGISVPDVDMFVLAYYERQKQVLNDINKINGSNKYRDWVTKELGVPSIKERLIDVLQAFAESERIFTTYDKDEFINAIGLTNRNGRPVKNISKLNEYLKEMGTGFQIITKRDGDKSRTTIYQVTKIV